MRKFSHPVSDSHLNSDTFFQQRAKVQPSKWSCLFAGLLILFIVATFGNSLLNQKPPTAQDSSGHVFGSNGFNDLLAQQVNSNKPHSNSDGSITLKSPLQSVEALITQNKTSFISTSNTDGGGQFSLSLNQWGRDSSLSNPEFTQLYQDDGKVYKKHKNGLTEQFISSSHGIQQNFILQNKPAGEGELELRISVEGASLSQKDNGVKVTLDESSRELTYDRLNVFDSKGKQLKAHMEIVESQMLAIRVDDTNALYPLTIDPTVSDADWVAMGGLAGANSAIKAIISVGTNVYIAGSFTTIGSQSIDRIAQWNGSTWSSVGTGIAGVVEALAWDSDNSILYAGGAFTEAGGNSANNIAQWNGTSWSALGSGTNNEVHSLVYTGTTYGLYVGGDFTSAGGTAINRIAQWNSSTWAAVGTGVDARVHALAWNSTNNLLYAGGSFTTAGGSTVNNISQWNQTSWTDLDSGTNNTVLSLEWDSTNNDLYVGGMFATAGSAVNYTVNFIARWDVVDTTWNRLHAGLNAMNVGSGTTAGLGYVWSMNWDDANGDLYVGGKFLWAVPSIDAANGTGTVLSHIGRWDGSSWNSLTSGVDTNAGANVLALAIDNTGSLFVGGVFDEVKHSNQDKVTAKNLAIWDSPTWSEAVSSSGLNARVRSMAWNSASNILYIGGDFTEISGNTDIQRVAQWNGSSWSTIGSATPVITRPVLLWVPETSTLYAGGLNAIRSWNGTSWSLLDSTNQPLRYIKALAWDNTNSELYAGGQCDLYDHDNNINTAEITIPTSCIAKWNGTIWSALGTGIKDKSEGSGYDPTYVYDLFWDNANSELYVAGNFIEANDGTTLNHIAKWDTTNGWSALGAGADLDIYSLAWDSVNDELYAGGVFSSIGSVTTNGVAMWDGTNWNALGTDAPLTDVIVWDSSREELFAGGRFNEASGAPGNYIAQWDGTSWSALGSGTGNYVATLLLNGSSDTLFVGGSFTTAGNNPSPYISQISFLTSDINLAITNISNSASTISQGNDTNFTITIENQSSLATTSGVELTISYDSQFSLNTTTGNTDANCNETQAGETVCTPGVMTGNSSEDLLLDFTADSGAGIASYTFNFSIAGTGADTESNMANNTDSDQVSIAAMADLAITLGDNTDPVLLNNNFTYNLIVSNNGPQAATNITAALTLDASTTFVSATGCTENAGVVSCTAASLANGANTSFNIITTASGAGTANASATVSADTTDSVNGNNSANQSTVITTASSDLSVTLTDSTDPIDRGNNFTYTLTTTNNGPDSASNVISVLTLSANTTFVSADAGCSHNAGVVTCNTATLASGENASFDIIVTASTAGTANASAQVSSDSADTDTGNNSATQSTTVNAVSADLSITLTTPSSSIFIDENATFTITISNAGPQTAEGISTSLHIPSDGRLVSNSASCSRSGPDVVCTQATLASGASTSFEVVFSASIVGGGLSGSMATSASVTSTTNDPNMNNNSALISRLPISTPTANMSIALLEDIDPVFVGENFTYKMRISNNGPQAASNAVATLVLHANTAFVSADSADCSESAGTVRCTSSSIGNGSSDRFDILVTALTVGTANATITASSSVLDTTTNNNSNTVSTIINALPVAGEADLSIVISDNADPVATGDQLIYNLVASNAGPDTAENVALLFMLPTNTSFVSASAGCSENSGLVTCTIASLASNASETRTVTLLTTVSGSVMANVSISSDTTDATAANNSASETTSVLISTAANLTTSLTRTGDAIIDVNETVTASLTITNDGNALADNVSVRIRVQHHADSALQFTGINAPQCTANGQQNIGPLSFDLYDCALGSIAPSVSTTVTVDATSPAEASEFIAIMQITATSMGDIEENLRITSSGSVEVNNGGGGGGAMGYLFLFMAGLVMPLRRLKKQHIFSPQNQ
jgi:uncharacterized repeat protein (TIGR01451 family)